MDIGSSPLLTDLYQLNMMQAYVDNGQTAPATFEFFVRRLPRRRAFLLAAGLEQVLGFLENLRFSEEELAFLAGTGRFRDNLIDYLATFRFTGDVDAMPEGTVVFADEPVLRITAPLPQGQLIEVAADQHPALPAAHRRQGGARAPGGARKADGRFRAAAGARRRGRVDGGARELHRGLCRNRDGAGRAAVRHSGLRHHGAFLCAGPRRRDHGVRELRAGEAEQSDAADRQLRYRGGSAEGGGAGAAPCRRRHHHPGGAPRQRRPGGAVPQRTQDSR